MRVVKLSVILSMYCNCVIALQFLTYSCFSRALKLLYTKKYWLIERKLLLPCSVFSFIIYSLNLNFFLLTKVSIIHYFLLFIAGIFVIFHPCYWIYVDISKCSISTYVLLRQLTDVKFMLAVTLVPTTWSSSRMRRRRHQTCRVPAFCEALCSVDRRPCCTAIVTLLYIACQKRRIIDRYGGGLLPGAMMSPATLLCHRDEVPAVLHRPRHQLLFRFLLLGYCQHLQSLSIIACPLLWWGGLLLVMTIVCLIDIRFIFPSFTAHKYLSSDDCPEDKDC